MCSLDIPIHISQEQPGISLRKYAHLTSKDSFNDERHKGLQGRQRQTVVNVFVVLFVVCPLLSFGFNDKGRKRLQGQQGQAVVNVFVVRFAF